MTTIAYQGAEGSFSHLTAVDHFGRTATFNGEKSFLEVFEKLQTGQADAAVIPIENSLIGSIYENYDLLDQYDMQIAAEQYTKIEHCLLGVGDHVKEIKRVLSHPKALEQCKHFFQTHPWMEGVIWEDTAVAAQDVAKSCDPQSAAIASRSAAALYGLKIINENIEDDPRNYTRFMIVQQKRSDDMHTNKCSLMFYLEHAPGTLAGALSLFSEQGMNLTKLESRPLSGSIFEYRFYADIEYPSHRALENVLKKLQDKLKGLKMLGFYKRGLRWNN